MVGCGGEGGVCGDKANIIDYGKAECIVIPKRL